MAWTDLDYKLNRPITRRVSEKQQDKFSYHVWMSLLEKSSFCIFSPTLMIR